MCIYIYILYVYVCVCVYMYIYIYIYIYCIGLVNTCDCVAGVAITRLEHITITAAQVTFTKY
jgi:hypothetical protein